MRDLFRDRLTLVKREGRRIEGLLAIVDGDRVTTISTDEPIEEGDTLQRTLQNGAVETYVVVGAHFRTGIEDLPSIYEVSVRNAASREPKGPGVQVFISHSTADTVLAGLLVDLLRAALNLPAKAIRCTSVDGHRLPAGADTDEQLRAEILAAPVFVGLVSRSSFASAYVLFELGARWGAQKTLMPLLAPGFDKGQLRGPVANLNALACERAQLHQLLEDIAEALGTRCEPTSSWQRALTRILDHAPANSAGEAQSKPPADEPLGREEFSILQVIAGGTTEGVPVAGLAQVLRWNENKVEHHAQRIVQRGYVEAQPYYGCGPVYALTPAGRRFLADNGLL